MPDNPLADLTTIREQLVENTRLLATPIDFTDLVVRGVLGPAKRGWYELLQPDQLPKHAGPQVIAVKSEKQGNVSRAFVRFGKTNASAARLYRKLTGKPFQAG